MRMSAAPVTTSKCHQPSHTHTHTLAHSPTSHTYTHTPRPGLMRLCGSWRTPCAPALCAILREGRHWQSGGGGLGELGCVECSSPCLRSSHARRRQSPSTIHLVAPLACSSPTGRRWRRKQGFFSGHLH